MTSPPKNPYLNEIVAAVYDAQQGAAGYEDRDIPLFLDYAARQIGPVLELACGTGRVLLPLARAGHQVAGIDSSPHMLAQARAKLAAEPEEVRQRVTLSQGDVREFQVEGRFSLVLIPFSTFNALTSPEEQQACLHCVRQHLLPGGLFVIDVWVPNPENIARPPGYINAYPAFSWPERNAMVLFSQVRVATDLAAQTFDVQWVYEVISADGTTIKHVVPLRLRHVYPQELVYLLERCGFRVVERFGGYGREPFNEKAQRQIVIAEKAD